MADTVTVSYAALRDFIARILEAAGASAANARVAAAAADGGALLPFGGHKGYALMTFIEVLTRIMMGGDDFAEAGRGGPVYGHQGVCMLLLRPDLFRDAGAYRTAAGELAAALRAVRPAPGFAEVLAPGDPERRTRAARTRDGIPLSAAHWRSLQETAAAVGAAPPAAE